MSCLVYLFVGCVGQQNRRSFLLQFFFFLNFWILASQQLAVVLGIELKRRNETKRWFPYSKSFFSSFFSLFLKRSLPVSFYCVTFVSKDVSHSLSHFLAHTRTTISTLELFFSSFRRFRVCRKDLARARGVEVVEGDEEAVSRNGGDRNGNENSSWSNFGHFLAKIK